MTATPLREAVKGFRETLGLDPRCLASEGKIVALRCDPLGAESRGIGRVAAGEAGRVTMRTAFGGRRIVDMLVGEQLPRIC